MGTLVFGFVFATFFAVLPLLAGNRLLRRVDEADEQQLRDLRQGAEAMWTDALLGSFAFLWSVGSLFLVVRGREIGWGYFLVAAIFVAAILVSRRQRRRLLETLGDRGTVERSERYTSSRALAWRWAVVGLFGYVGARVVQYADPDPLSDAGRVLVVLLGTVTFVGTLGFVVVRVRMWQKGFDLDGGSRT